MARFGIRAENALGCSIPRIRAVAKKAGVNQTIAEELWKTGIHDARILASLVGDPTTISRATMNSWARDFSSWDICDACCNNLFDRTPHAWALIPKWAASKREYVRRAAFSTIASICVHDKSAPDAVFLDALKLVEHYASDDRNFVRKAVNWALRSIGKRNASLLREARSCAARIRAQDTRSARWIAADALREWAERGRPG